MLQPADSLISINSGSEGTNRLFYIYPQTKTTSLWHLTVDGKLVACSATFLFIHRSIVFKIFFYFFYLRIFTDKKSVDVIILPIIWVLKFFLLSRFRLVFLPTTLISLPPGVMLLNRSPTTRDSATDIEKTSRKGALEWERPNGCVVMIMLWDRSDSVVFWGFQWKSVSPLDSASNFTRDSVLISNFPNFDYCRSLYEPPKYANFRRKSGKLVILFKDVYYIN